MNSNYLNKFKEGIYFGFGFFIIFGIFLGVGFAGWHSASQIIPGIFIGNFTFNGNVDINNSFIVGEINMSPVKTKVIYFNDSMTAQDILNIIDSQSKFIPFGNTLTFQFKDGTYILDKTLYFQGFYGGGAIKIIGNTSESGAGTLRTNQSVFLDFEQAHRYGLVVTQNGGIVYINNLKIKFDSSISWYHGILVGYNSKASFIDGNYIYGISTNYGSALYNAYGSLVYFSDNYVSNVNRGINCAHSLCSVQNNLDTGTLPAYGLYSQTTGIIGKIGTVHPSGSTSAEYSSNGGLIIT